MNTNHFYNPNCYSFRDQDEKGYDYVAVGREIYQVWHDGLEELAASCLDEDAADKTASNWNLRIGR